MCIKQKNVIWILCVKQSIFSIKQTKTLEIIIRMIFMEYNCINISINVDEKSIII